LSSTAILILMLFYDRTSPSLGRLAMQLGALLAILFVPIGSGCVERRMTIRTNPPGALVYVDDYEIGATPVSADFTYYGTRKIRIVKDGYETLTVMQPFQTPWYEFPPVDFITENFVPGKIRDQRILDYQLKPQMIVPNDQLMCRAEGLRRNNLITPSAAVPPPPNTVVPGAQPAPQNTLPATVPGTLAPANSYPAPAYPAPAASAPSFSAPSYLAPDTSIPPGAAVPPGTAIQPGAAAPPGMYQPQSGIGGQPVYELPPR
jgi:hypothetical protein